MTRLAAFARQIDRNLKAEHFPVMRQFLIEEREREQARNSTTQKDQGV